MEKKFFYAIVGSVKVKTAISALFLYSSLIIRTFTKRRRK